MCLDGKCVDHCKKGFFVDEESRDCEPCHRDCRTCGGPRYDDCDSCEDEFVLINGECVKDRQFALCPETHFRNSMANFTSVLNVVSVTYLSLLAHVKCDADSFHHINVQLKSMQWNIFFASFASHPLAIFSAHGGESYLLFLFHLHVIHVYILCPGFCLLFTIRSG